jgi:branched-chain amino acid transport system ATP-binding protein
LFDSLSVLANVSLGAYSTTGIGLDASRNALHLGRDIDARALQLLEELGIAGEAHRLPADLPYPVRKRVALARALMSDPALVLLDEPAGGIAQADIDALAVLVRGLTPKRSVLVVEHHMDFVMGVCDHIYVLDAGRIIAEGDPAAIQQNAAVRAAYLGVEN